MCEWGRTAETMNKLYTRQVIRGFHIFGSYLCFPPCYFSIWLVCDPLYTLALPPFQKNPQLKKFLFILLSIHVFKCILFGGFLSVLAIWKWPSWCVILSFLQEFLQEGNSCRKEFLQEGNSCRKEFLQEGKGKWGVQDRALLSFANIRNITCILLLLYFIALFYLFIIYFIIYKPQDHLEVFFIPFASLSASK